MRLLREVESCIFRFLKGLSILCLIALLVLVFAQITGRYFGIAAIMPQDEIITLFFVWLVFIGSALLVRENDHIRIELVDGFLRGRPRLKCAVDVLVNLVVVIFLAAMTKSAFAANQIAALKGSPMLQWPDTIWYTSLPVSAILMLVYTSIRLLGSFRALATGKLSGAPAQDA